MRNKKLEILIGLATLFFLAHTVDHVARDLQWPLTAQAVPFLAATAAILLIVFGALYLYRRGSIGARFWAIFGAITVAVGWLAHLSPYTDQPVSYIYNFYRSPLAAGLAVGSLLALMLSLVLATLYAGLLWLQSRRIKEKPENPAESVKGGLPPAKRLT
jgi:hypothetical protein